MEMNRQVNKQTNKQNKPMKKIMLITAALCGLLSSLQPAFAVPTAFTLQGRLALAADGTPATRNFDMSFAIFGSPSGTDLVKRIPPISPVAVNNGLFIV